MATNPTATAVATNPNLKPQTADWGVILEANKNEDGTVEHSLKAIQGDKAIQEAREKGTLQFVQTFGYDFPANDEGFKILITDDEERNDIAVAGYKNTRINPRIRRELEAYKRNDDGSIESTFEQVEGVYDFRDKASEEAKRKNLTPEEKAFKNMRSIPVFAGFTDDQLRMFIASAPAMAAQHQNSSEESEAEEVTA